jgi:hypothetical protein
MENTAQTLLSFAVEVIADDSGTFVGNGVCLSSRGEADSYGQDLKARWRLVRQYRVVERNEPANYAFVNGKLVSLSIQNTMTM